jgi:hypothetical protein
MPRISVRRRPIKAAGTLALTTLAYLAVIPNAAATPVGPCNVGANTPVLQPDPYGTAPGPRVGYSGGISCSQSTSYISVTVCLRVLNGWTWYVVSGTCGTNTRSDTTFVGWGSMHIGADGHVYDTTASGVTSYGQAQSVSPAWRAP